MSKRKPGGESPPDVKHQFLYEYIFNDDDTVSSNHKTKRQRCDLGLRLPEGAQPESAQASEVHDRRPAAAAAVAAATACPAVDAVRIQKEEHQGLDLFERRPSYLVSAFVSIENGGGEYGAYDLTGCNKYSRIFFAAVWHAVSRVRVSGQPLLSVGVASVTSSTTRSIEPGKFSTYSHQNHFKCSQREDCAIHYPSCWCSDKRPIRGPNDCVGGNSVQIHVRVVVSDSVREHNSHAASARQFRRLLPDGSDIVDGRAEYETMEFVSMELLDYGVAIAPLLLSHVSPTGVVQLIGTFLTWPKASEHLDAIIKIPFVGLPTAGTKPEEDTLCYITRVIHGKYEGPAAVGGESDTGSAQSQSEDESEDEDQDGNEDVN